MVFDCLLKEVWLCVFFKACYVNGRKLCKAKQRHHSFTHSHRHFSTSQTRKKIKMTRDSMAAEGQNKMPKRKGKFLLGCSILIDYLTLYTNLKSTYLYTYMATRDLASSAGQWLHIFVIKLCDCYPVSFSKAFSLQPRQTGIDWSVIGPAYTPSTL